jgi:hypothetical protein
MPSYAKRLALFHTFSLSNIVTIPLCVCLASSSILHIEINKDKFWDFQKIKQMKIYN